ncbi:MAG: hypothetical protein LBG64_00895 [Pseudomonadales bacterium]|jgi:hypothetical protein|nr:hypothetical protein [Pseudomonadales bacterium]
MKKVLSRIVGKIRTFLFLPLCVWLLKTIYPDQNELIGEGIEKGIEKREHEFWVAMKGINDAIGEENGGGLLDNQIAPTAITEKVKKLATKKHLYGYKLKKICFDTQSTMDDVVPTVKKIVEQYDESNTVIDIMEPAIKSANRAFNRLRAYNIKREELEREVKNDN